MDHRYVQFSLNENMNDDTEDIENIEPIESSSDELLIDAVRGYIHLYDSSLKEYKDVQMKENSWREIAVLMEMPVATCQNRWQRLRERFTKEQRLQEAESRSGSGASRRAIFPLYSNMLFLKNHIKRRKSFTNVKSFKKRTDNMPNLSSNECNSATSMPQKLNRFETRLESTSLLPRNESRNSFCVSSEIVNPSVSRDYTSSLALPPQTESRNSCITSEIVSPSVSRDYISSLAPPPRTESRNSCISSETDSPSVSRDYTSSLAPPPRTESRDSCISSETGSPSVSRDYTSSLAPPPRTESRNSCISSEIGNPSVSRDTDSSFAPYSTVRRSVKDSTGKIKNKSNAYLESSLVSLSNTIQNRIANQSVSEQAWNLNNLTPDKIFALLVATELERLPEEEKSKRKQAIINILWNSTQ